VHRYSFIDELLGILMVAVKKCPKCRSTRIAYFAGMITGNYHCKECGYVGPLIIEEDEV